MADIAERPTDIPRAGWIKAFGRIRQGLVEDRVSLIAAGIAFYGLLALFPGIAACMALAGLIAEPTAIANQIAEIGRLLPAEAADIVINQATAVAGSEEGGLGLAALLGLLLTFYSASRGVASLIEGLNAAYHVTETRGFVKLYALTFGLTFCVILGIALAIGATVAVPATLTLLHLGGGIEALVATVTYGVLLVFTVAGLACLYRFAPDRPRPRWRWITPGAAVAALAWFLGSLAFGWYVANFGSYNETFGTLGGVVVLLTWMWLSAFIVLIGAEIDSALEAVAAPGAGQSVKTAREARSEAERDGAQG